jgi:hypothetical protein
MNTVYHVIPEIGSMRTIVTETLPEKPRLDHLRKLIEPHLDGERLEHVSVLWEGQRRDMFVGETSSINGRMIRNIRATEIYRNNWLTRNLGADPESLPAISGPAVLFDRIVWF